MNKKSIKIVFVCLILGLMGLCSVGITSAEQVGTNVAQTLEPIQNQNTSGLMSASITNAENYSYVGSWGSGFGSDNGQFIHASGIAVDSFGNVYVADSGNNRIQKFDSSYTYLTHLGTLGSGNGQFNNPSGIAVDSLGNVYVVDLGNFRIQKFDSNYTYLTQWGFGLGSGNGQFKFASGIAVDSLGNVYVADSGNNRIQKFGSSGKYLLQWGYQGNADLQLKNPCGVAIDSNGNVYVADNGNCLIKKFDSNGNLITKWGTRGTGNGQLDAPSGVAVDSYDNVYVADRNNNRIQKFSVNDNSIAFTPVPTLVAKLTAPLVNASEKIKPAIGNEVSLTGVWNCDDKGTYYLRQIGNTLWWYGEQKSNNLLWSNVAHGTITDNTINLEWVDVPKGSNQFSGTLMTLNIDSNNQLRAVYKKEGFGGSVWTR